MEELIIGDCHAKVPIIQGGMGVGISLSGLAAAVANAGGIGVISAAAIGMFEPDYMKNFREANKRALRREIQKAKQLAPGGIIGVNIMIALTDHEDLIRAAIEEEADLVIIGAGLPLKIPAVLENAGLKNFRTKLVIKVSSAKAAKLIFQSWSSRYNRIPDAVVVEGPMAGGHLGFKKEELGENLVPLDQLIRETVKEVAVFEQIFAKEVPVIAAGGIYTGDDMFSIMQAGAKAVKMGTRFVTTHECDASLAFKESYLACNKEDLTIINSPVGLPGRVVNSHFVEQIKEGKTEPFRCSWKCLSNCNYKEAPYCIALALFNAAQGRMDEGFAFAGSNAYKAQSIQHVSEIFEELITEYHNASIAYQTKDTKELSLEIPFIRAVS